MSIRARKLKNGKTVYDAVLEYGTIDGTRTRSTRTFATRKEAEKAEQDARRYRNAVYRRTGNIRLSEYIERFYWPTASRRLAATSRDTYSKDIRLRIMPSLGDCFLDEIDRLKIQRMVDACNTESTARKSVQTLKTILNEAVGDGLIASNPACARFAWPGKGKKRDKGLVLTNFEDIASFIAEVQNDAPEAITRLVMSGLMLGLRPEERDRKRQIAVIRKSPAEAGHSVGWGIMAY